MGLRVRAKTLSDEQKFVGYYDLKRRRPGEEFELAKPGDFSDFWMEPVGWEPAPVSMSERLARAEAYTQRLHAAAVGVDPAALDPRAEALRYEMERQRIRQENPADVGAQPVARPGRKPKVALPPAAE